MNDIKINRDTHDQLINLIDQLIEFTSHQDSLNRQKDPVKNCGEGFLTSKLNLIKNSLLNDN
jgi:hypothetical protein